MNLIKKIGYSSTAAILVKLTNEIVKELNGGRYLTINGKQDTNKKKYKGITA